MTLPTLPTWAPAWLLARYTSDANLLLITVTHPKLETLRFVRNPTPITKSNGDVYMAAWFELFFVNDDGKPPKVSFRFPNVDTIIGEMIGTLTVPPVEVTIESVSSAHLDDPLERAAHLQLLNPSIAPDFISGELCGRDWSNEPLGKIVVTPKLFPALFRRRY